MMTKILLVLNVIHIQASRKFDILPAKIVFINNYHLCYSDILPAAICNTFISRFHFKQIQTSSSLIVCLLKLFFKIIRFMLFKHLPDAICNIFFFHFGFEKVFMLELAVDLCLTSSKKLAECVTVRYRFVKNHFQKLKHFAYIKLPIPIPPPPPPPPPQKKKKKKKKITLL